MTLRPNNRTTDQMMGWSHTYTHTSPHRESELNFVLKKDIYIFSLIVSLYTHAENKRLARNAPKHIYFGKAGLWAAFIYFFFKFFHNNFELVSLLEKIFLKICDIFLLKINQMSLNSHFAWKRDKWNDTTKKQVDNIQKMEPFIKKPIIFSKSWYDKGKQLGEPF